MKPNEAPEKIYIDANEDWHRTYTAYTEKAKGNDIEYTRTDAFIERVCKWLEENVERHISSDGEYTVYYEEIFEELRKYMKGEKA